jgi:hypothetical protein
LTPKLIYKHVSMTLDVETIRKCRSLANRKGQSVSSLIRYLVCGAYEKATAAKREERAIEDC